MPHWARLQQVAADWRAAVVVCAGLLLLRSWFFLAWEESYFDSDQAIVGLMAKHLAEGRSWPLYFYGQEYILAVEAWVAAPFFALFGTSVATLRAVIVALNLATGLILVWRLVKDAGLPVWSAVAASGIFWAAPFITSANLVEATGANIEPFLWVLLLWLLRRRPLALGVCLAIAVLNREFSIYAAPMLALTYVIEEKRRVRDAALHGTAAAVAFVTVYTGITLLKPFADLLGPGTLRPAGGHGGQGRGGHRADPRALEPRRPRPSVSGAGDGLCADAPRIHALRPDRYRDCHAAVGGLGQHHAGDHRAGGGVDDAARC